MSNDLKKDRLIDSFLSNLRLEKGLSENTIKAYSNDCYAFSKWLFSKKKYQVLSATEKDIENYLKHFPSFFHLTKHLVKKYRQAFSVHHQLVKTSRQELSSSIRRSSSAQRNNSSGILVTF